MGKDIIFLREWRITNDAIIVFRFVRKEVVSPPDVRRYHDKTFSS